MREMSAKMFLFVFRIGIAEKGSMSVELKVDSSVGHASMPPKESSIGILCNAIARYFITQKYNVDF